MTRSSPGVLVQVSGVQFFHGGQKLEIAPRRARTEALAASRMLNTLRLTAEEGMHLVVPSTGKRFGIDLSR
ncbi:MAG: hypothetical protein HY053_04400 [Proteobacteria bacterium]|nr:hypothetical protein [Pseudomonadota bacterium]